MWLLRWNYIFYTQHTWLTRQLKGNLYEILRGIIFRGYPPHSHVGLLKGNLYEILRFVFLSLR